MNQYGPVWSHMVSYGPLWSIIVPYGPLWSLMVPYGPVYRHELNLPIYKTGIVVNLNSLVYGALNCIHIYFDEHKYLYQMLVLHD